MDIFDRRRQYIHQLQKWGVKKSGNDGQLAIASTRIEPPPVLASPSTDPGLEKSIHKRERSLASFKTNTSRVSKPIQPPKKKKEKLNSFIQAKVSFSTSVKAPAIFRDRDAMRTANSGYSSATLRLTITNDVLPADSRITSHDLAQNQDAATDIVSLTPPTDPYADLGSEFPVEPGEGDQLTHVAACTPHSSQLLA